MTFQAPDSTQASLGGAPAYVPRTTWGPLWAAVATAAIFLSALGLSTIGVVVFLGLGGRAGESLMTLIALAIWQVAIILLTLAAAAWRGNAWDVLSVRPAPAVRTYVQALALVIAIEIVVTTLEFVFVPQEMFRDLRSFVEIARGPWWILGFLIVGVGAPLSEELLFRGFLFSALARSRIAIAGAALVSTVLWTALHAGYTVVGLVEIFSIGLIFSWLLWKTGSLRVTILCHAVYNALIMLALRYLPLPAALLPA